MVCNKLGNRIYSKQDENKSHAEEPKQLVKEEEVMLPFPDEALWIADEEVSPNRAADKEDAEEVDLGVSAEDIESTEDLSEVLLCRVVMAQPHQPEVAGQ